MANMTNEHSMTGHIAADAIILSAGWGIPLLLNLSLSEVSEVILHIAQISTTVLVLITAILRYRIVRKDKKENKEENGNKSDS